MKNLSRKKTITTLLSMTFAAAALIGCGPGSVDSKDEALEQLSKILDKKVDFSQKENTYRANIQLTQTNLLSILPGINEYPMTLDANDSTQVEAVEIFTSSEKAGKQRDGFYLEMAELFNRERIEISNGKTAQIGIRKIASGLGAQFILAQRYVPDAFSPSNHLWGDMLSAQGIDVTQIAEVTAPNTAGVIVRKSKKNEITTNNELDVQKLLNAVTGGSFSMGYTNPYQSSTGLNFLLTILNAFAEGNEAEFLAPDVASAFEAFQQGVPFVAQTTLQMRDAAVNSGVLDALVMEHQSWVNVKGMGDYEFVPFGVRHDSPLYATPEADSAEREVLTLFAQFIENNRARTRDYGFGQNPKYKSDYSVANGATILGAQKIWKDKKSGGRPIAAMFVADVSGQQKSLFMGAVESLSASGGTATNDAVLVALNELNDYSKSNPDHKLVVFVLSDGETNKGLEYKKVVDIMQWTDIPIHTIAYELTSEHLKSMASLAEGAYIESSADSASYRIGNLLNSEM